MHNLCRTYPKQDSSWPALHKLPARAPSHHTSEKIQKGKKCDNIITSIFVVWTMF